MARKKDRPKNKFRTFIKVQIVLMALVLSGVCFYCFSGYGAEVKVLHDDAVYKVSHSTEDTFKASQTSLAYDNKGELISVLKGEKDMYYLEVENIPKYLKDAFVCVEDKKFYTHSGIDLKAILRAIKGLIENQEIVSGGSTITQQLSRNVFLNHETTWQRKVEEIFIALELEKVYSKSKILEFYLNNIYFSNGYYGVEAASRGYFSKSVKDLTLSEMVYLAAIPNNPSLYDPLLYPDNTISRRDFILGQMKEDGFISQSEYDEALNQKIILNMTSIEEKNYVETYTYYCATRELMRARGFEFKTVFKSVEEQMDYEEAYSQLFTECQMMLYTGGYRIYTSIDMEKQAKLQQVIDDTMADYVSVSPEGVYQLQSGAVCINNETRKVEAIVGGRTQEEIKGLTLNRGYQSYRQPGSTIKPLIVYIPSIERGYTPDTIVEDKEIEDGPENADKTYSGKMTLRQAVAQSKNTIAWNLFAELSPNVGLSYLEEMKFKALEPTDYLLPASIGGFTTGVSAVEMAGAYCAVVNDGIHTEPSCITKITDSEGKDVLGERDDTTVVYMADACRIMTDMLQTVMQEGTGKGFALDNMTCAGKTGTTDDDKDSWFVGYTPYYTTCLWVGYDYPQILPGDTPKYPLMMWKQFMEDIHTGLENKPFPVATDLKREDKKNEAKSPQDT